MQKSEPGSPVEQSLTAALRARSAGDLDTAARQYRRVLALDPAHHGALHNLGVIAAVRGRHGEAVEWYRRALAACPAAADTHNNLGAAYKDLGDFACAIGHLEESLRLRPGHAAAHNNLGSLYLDLHDARAALPHCERAAELDPGNVFAWRNLGRAAFAARGPAAALEPLSRALHLDPAAMETNAALGAVLAGLGRFAEAIPCYERILAARPGSIEILADLVHLRQHLCDWTGLERNVARIREHVATAPDCGIAPFFFMVLPGTLAREQRLCAEKYARRLLRHPPAATASSCPDTPRRGPRLRLGYLAAHFQDHATLRLLVGVLERHDRSRFEVIGISGDPAAQGPIPPRTRAALDHWLDLRAVGDAEAIAAIRAQAIDILIDAQGYSRGARPGIPAGRPAPVQAAYLVYPGTSGAPFIDYLVADRTVIPPELGDAYTERVLYLPHTYQATDDRRVTGPATTRQQWDLPAEGLVFCCFNQTYKIAPALFDVWCRVLAAVPGSVLWLWASEATAPANLRREARARGIAPERLVFCPTVSQEDHLARIALADLFLDTFPCNAHTTASDALWMGVPLVTCAGETFVSRVAASILGAAGLGDLVTGSLHEYETRVLALAADPAALAAVRRRVADCRTAPLFDTARLTRDLETLYEQMWREKSTGSRDAAGSQDEAGPSAAQ